MSQPSSATAPAPAPADVALPRPVPAPLPGAAGRTALAPLGTVPQEVAAPSADTPARLRRLRLAVVLGSAAAVGAATAVAGAIGFVGLVVPHLLRGAVGAMPSRLLPAAGLGGAALVLAADVAVRLILPERDLKLGVMMALVGAPVFLHLIWRTQAGR